MSTSRPAPDAIEELAATLRRGFGDDLRRITYYAGSESAHLYLRPDVRERLSEAGLREVVNDSRIDAFARPQQEKLYPHGELHCVLRGFEDAFELNVILSDREGVAIAFDPGALTGLRTLIDRCRELLDA